MHEKKNSSMKRKIHLWNELQISCWEYRSHIWKVYRRKGEKGAFSVCLDISPGVYICKGGGGYQRENMSKEERETGLIFERFTEGRGESSDICLSEYLPRGIYWTLHTTLGKMAVDDIKKTKEIRAREKRKMGKGKEKGVN